MRKIGLFSILSLLMSCTNAQKSQPFIFDSQYVLEFETNDIEISELSFVEVESISSDLDRNGVEDVILLYDCEGWENDPGAFRKVVIELNGVKVVEEVNLGGWVRFDKKLLDGAKDDLFILIKGELPLLGFAGYNYASEPGYLTLIILNGSESKVVFNQKFDLEEIIQEANEFELKGEFEENMKTIWIGPSELKFK